MLCHNKPASMAEKPRGCLPSTLKCLVWALQCLGLLCFKRSPSPAVPDSAEISVPLLLWAIFVKTYQITYIIFIPTNAREYGVSNVGQLTRQVLFMISCISLVVGQISLIINGPILNHILSECEIDICLKEVRWPLRRFSFERIMTPLFYCSNLAVLFFTLLPYLYIRPGSDLYQNIAFCLFLCPNLASIMLIVILFRELLTIASSKLSVNFLRLDECSCGTDAAGLEPHLYSLERKIHKVSPNA